MTTGRAATGNDRAPAAPGHVRRDLDQRGAATRERSPDRHRTQSSKWRVYLRVADHCMGDRVARVTQQADLANAAAAMVRTSAGGPDGATGRHVTRCSYRVVVS